MRLNLRRTMVGVGVPVAVVNQERIVCDSVEHVDHLVDAELAIAVVIEQAVKCLQLLDIELLRSSQVLDKRVGVRLVRPREWKSHRIIRTSHQRCECRQGKRGR